MISPTRRGVLYAALLVTATPGLGLAQAPEPFKVGLILPMSGPFASTGREIDAAVKLYIAQHGSEVAGRKIEVILKDDGGSPDNGKRIAQEMIVNDHVGALAGFGLTPIAFSVAPVATQAKVPMIVMAAATSAIVKASPFILRTSYTTPQVTTPIAAWAAKNGVKRPMTIVSDYGPGIDAETAFKASFEKSGGQVASALRIPLMNPDFAPFLQKIADENADAVYAFVPSGAGATFMKQFTERGLDKKGVRLIVEGGVTDDDILNQMGDPAIGVISGYHYSAAHDSALNKTFVTGFRAANPGMRPNFMAVGGYDGMHVVYQMLEKTGGKGDGAKLVDSMKGFAWESPRGPVTIDAETHDIVQNVYMRKVERKDGELYNVEFETIPNAKDPVKAN